MKNICFISLICFLAFQAATGQNAEKFYVVHTEGTTFQQKNGHELKLGDSLIRTDEIRFADKLSILTLYTDKGNRYKALDTSAQKKTFKLYQVLEVPEKAYVTKRCCDEDTIREWDLDYVFVNKFNKKKPIDFCFYEFPATFLIKLHSLPIEDEKKYILAYTYFYQNKRISKPLKIEKNSFQINKDVYLVNGQPVDAEKIDTVSITLVNRYKMSAKTIATFTPVFPNPEQFRKECQLLADIFKKVAVSQKLNENYKFWGLREVLSIHVTEVYGNVHFGTFYRWVDKNVKF